MATIFFKYFDKGSKKIMLFNLKTKIVKMDNYEALVQRVSEEKATLMANKFVAVNYSMFNGWVCELFNKKGSVIAVASFNALSTVQSLSTEFNEVEVDYTNSKIFIKSNQGKNKFYINITDEVFVCANCGKIIKIDGKKHRCRMSNVCSVCGNEIDAKIIDKYGNRGICPTCWAKQNSEFSPYSTKPAIDFLKHASELQDIGIEVEVDDSTGRADRQQTCRDVGKILNVIEPYHKTFVFSGDGSLYHGFEIKTSPRPLNWFIKHKNEFSKAFELISERGFKGHDANTTGFHISVNLANRSEVYALKMAYFWSKNIKFFDIIARRTSTRSSSCYYQYKNLTDRPLLDNLASKSHRDVVNLEHLDINRLEIRHFRSTLKVDTLIATIDIMQAVDKFLQSKTTEQILKGKYTMQEVINKITTDEAKAYINSKKQAFADAGYSVEV